MILVHPGSPPFLKFVHLFKDRICTWKYHASHVNSTNETLQIKWLQKYSAWNVRHTRRVIRRVLTDTTLDNLLENMSLTANKELQQTTSYHFITLVWVSTASSRANVLLVLQLGLLVVSTLLHSVFPQITGTYLQRTYYSTAVFVS